MVWKVTSVKATLWFTLYALVRLGAHRETICVSTSTLSQLLESSQQTASRHLAELHRINCIEKQSTFQGMEIKLTEKGVEEVQLIHHGLKGAFEAVPPSVVLEGTVISGLGDGSYYMSQEWYRGQFEKALGFVPYAGTLNLKLSPSVTIKRRALEVHDPVVIEGSRRGGRTFGRVYCYPVLVNDQVQGAVITIVRTHHDDTILEVIAPVHLRSTLRLDEGSKVKLVVYQQQAGIDAQPDRPYGVKSEG
jgi:riboflavin kinase